MPAIGYDYLITRLGLDTPALRRPARIRPLTRVGMEADHIGIPNATAPKTEDPIDHLVFALKHEGTNLGVLMPALRKIAGSDIVREVRRTPTGAYARWLGYLWEKANKAELTDLPAIGGWVPLLFDQQRYITGLPQRNAKWRVDFNGLGTINYCITVERSAAIQAGIDSKLPQRVNDYASNLTNVMRDRTVAWAYLSETRDSFAIEREEPSELKKTAFVNLLRQAHEARDLTEDYLTSLQQATVSNRLDVAFSFRTQQNHLQRGLLGSAGVTYVPPPPEIATELMGELMGFANALPQNLDPIVAAAVISFGFVFIHPFMDGNGRLSRFLFHHTLCRTRALPNGLILPVSVAMKKNEDGYLNALQSFSGAAREAWQVKWVDGDNYAFKYQWNDDFDVYRYWDATACVEFSYRMAEQALAVELRQETEFLLRYDKIYRAVSEKYDLRQSDLATLIIMTLENNGRVSKNRRKQYGERVAPEVLDYIESTATEALLDSTDDHNDDDDRDRAMLAS